jgi:hypothetical protein
MPTLGQVLRSPGLELQVVVAGTGDPPVRWVATSELVDPTPFLEGGEIVLTTGLATGEWTEEWQSYVDRLAAARASALGLGLGLTHARVPARLRDAARAVDLPLFTVAHAVPFVAVSRTVARLVQREEQQALRAAMSVQQQLTRDAAGTDGAEAVLRRLARIVSGDAVVCDPDGAVLLRETVVRDQRAPDRIPESIRALIACLRPDGLRTSHTDTGPRGSTLVQPLGLAGSPHSYLVLSTPAPWGTTAPAPWRPPQRCCRSTASAEPTRWRRHARSEAPRSGCSSTGNLTRPGPCLLCRLRGPHRYGRSTRSTCCGSGTVLTRSPVSNGGPPTTPRTVSRPSRPDRTDGGNRWSCWRPARIPSAPSPPSAPGGEPA